MLVPRRRRRSRSAATRRTPKMVRCRRARSPGTSTSCTKATCIPGTPVDRRQERHASRSRPSGHDFSGNTRYRITLTVTDSDGLPTTQSVTRLPGKVNLTFGTLPSGLTLYVDGIATRDAIRLRHADRLRPHDRGARPDVGQERYTFASWSDGGAQSHEISRRRPRQSYVATFQAGAGRRRCAAYGFDEGSRDRRRPTSSGNGNTGHDHDGAIWTRGQVRHRRCRFNGSSNYVDLGNPCRVAD